MTDKQRTKNNFGGVGWYYIILTAILFYVNTLIAVDGLNVSVAAFEARNGWSQAQLLNYSAIGGYISIISAPFIGMWLGKKGVRFVTPILLMVSGVATIWWGTSVSTTQWLIACAIVCACANGYSHLASSTLANNWFPQKKGLFLGWSTMGVQLSSVCGVAMLNIFINHFDINGAYIIIGVLQILLGILCVFTVRNKPMDMGKYPDNMPMSDEELAAYTKESEEHVSTLTLGQILKDKNTWLIAIPFGVLYMTAIGVLSQWVPRLSTLGYDPNFAILLLSIVAAIGLVGSYAFGWIDVKFGPKVASIGLLVDYCVAVFLLVLPHNPVFLYTAGFLFGMGIGGVANLVGSLVGSIWGVKEFARVFGIINTIEGVIRVTAFSVLAFGLTRLGGYSGAYAIFLVLCVIGTVMMCFVKVPDAKKQ